MNRSQLLYKISNLQYNIRLKESEYNDAVAMNDQFKISVSDTALSCLKKDLAITVQEFDALEIMPDTTALVIKKKKWWQAFFGEGMLRIKDRSSGR